MESCNLPEAPEYIRALTYIGHLINKAGSILIAAYYYKSNIWIYYINIWLTSLNLPLSGIWTWDQHQRFLWATSPLYLNFSMRITPRKTFLGLEPDRCFSIKIPQNWKIRPSKILISQLDHHFFFLPSSHCNKLDEVKSASACLKTIDNSSAVIRIFRSRQSTDSSQ